MRLDGEREREETEKKKRKKSYAFFLMSTYLMTQCSSYSLTTIMILYMFLGFKQSTLKWNKWIEMTTIYFLFHYCAVYTSGYKSLENSICAKGFILTKCGFTAGT